MPHNERGFALKWITKQLKIKKIHDIYVWRVKFRSKAMTYHTKIVPSHHLHEKNAQTS